MWPYKYSVLLILLLSQVLFCDTNDWEEACRDSNLMTYVILQNEEKKNRQTNEINQYRLVYGQYHTLFELFKKYPNRFKNYMRMNLATFQYILSKIEGKLTKKWCNLHRPIYPEEQLVVTLRYTLLKTSYISAHSSIIAELKGCYCKFAEKQSSQFLITGSSYNDLSTTFLMSECTICTTVKNVMNVLWDELQPHHMPVPKKNQLRKIAEDFFKKWQFPHCLGAIDCRHMRIKKPAHSKSLYFNWKKFYSIKLQAVVDAFYRFIFIEVGDCGSTHDSTTFKNSNLFNTLRSGKLEYPEDDELPNSKIILPYFFIGDGAYMLQEHLMKPFRGKNLPVRQQNFNKRLSRARMVVECAFGHLVQMWKIFKTRMEYTPETAILITKCACLLRNVIIDMEGPESDTFPFENDGSTAEETLLEDPDCDQEIVVGLVGYGKEVREELVKYCMQHPT